MSPNEWENYFTEAASKVEELLVTGDLSTLDQSKIRIALENKILSWDKYKQWVQSKFDYMSLNSELAEFQVMQLKSKYLENEKTYSHFGIWSNDLIAIDYWDKHLVILGLTPIEKIATIPDAIFVLCPPHILSQIIETKQSDDVQMLDDNSVTEHENQDLQLLELDQNIVVSADLNFSNITISETSENVALAADLEKSLVYTEKTQPAIKKEPTHTESSVWSHVDTHHRMNSDLALKRFDAYMVLKVADNKTRVYKMDEDLLKEDINEGLFLYDLNTENVFAKIYKTGVGDSFKLDQLGLSILDFKYACIYPIKMGPKVLGFIIGFKVKSMTEDDENILEMISLKNVA